MPYISLTEKRGVAEPISRKEYIPLIKRTPEERGRVLELAKPIPPVEEIKKPSLWERVKGLVGIKPEPKEEPLPVKPSWWKTVGEVVAGIPVVIRGEIRPPEPMKAWEEMSLWEKTKGVVYEIPRTVFYGKLAEPPAWEKTWGEMSLEEKIKAIGKEVQYAVPTSISAAARAFTRTISFDYLDIPEPEETLKIDSEKKATVDRLQNELAQAFERDDVEAMSSIIKQIKETQEGMVSIKPEYIPAISGGTAAALLLN